MPMKQHGKSCDKFNLTELLAWAGTGPRGPGDVCLVQGKDRDFSHMRDSTPLPVGCAGLIGFRVGLQPAIRSPGERVWAPNCRVDLHTRIVDEDRRVGVYSVR